MPAAAKADAARYAAAEQALKSGAVAGANLWLLENLAFGARADWFERTSLLLSVLYRF